MVSKRQQQTAAAMQFQTEYEREQERAGSRRAALGAAGVFVAVMTVALWLILR